MALFYLYRIMMTQTNMTGNPEVGIINHLVSDARKREFSAAYKDFVENGMKRDHFTAFKDEISWVLSFIQTHRVPPNEATMLKKFPHFSILVSLEPIKFYIEEVYESNLRSAIIKLNKSTLSELNAGNIRAAALEMSLIKDALTLNVPSSDMELVADVDERIDSYENTMNQKGIAGISCGLPSFDKELGGFMNKEFTLVTGRPGTGKTWLMLFFSYKAWLDGYNVVIFSKEMSSKHIFRRKDSIITKVPFSVLKHSEFSSQVEFEDFKQLLKLTISSRNNKYYVVGTSDLRSGYTTDFIYSKIKELGSQIAFIDGVYMLDTSVKTAGDWQKYTQIASDIKSLAMSANIPVVGTSQLNRKSKEKGAQSIDTVSFSDGLSQYADNIMAGKTLFDNVTGDRTDLIKLSLAKIRDGEPISRTVKMDLTAMTLTESTQELDTTNSFPLPEDGDVDVETLLKSDK